jgi:hypothetical protein
MIVGDPTSVSFEFQCALAIDYAVGRLHLPDADAYRRYAKAAIDSESQFFVTARNAVLFGPTNQGDEATRLSATQLLGPLVQELKRPGAPKNWQVQDAIGAVATKQRLAEFLQNAEDTPVIFSASHGIGFDAGEEGQIGRQGAILCQDWRAGVHPVSSDHYFSRDDLVGLGSLQRLVWFAFACYGAGTPKFDNFPGNPNLLTRTQLASDVFQSGLATRLLSHAAGPALGFIGHIDTAWVTSFQFGSATGQIKDFRQCLERIMRGERLGHALNVLGQKYASLSAILAVEMIVALQAGTAMRRNTAARVARYWTAAMDARNFVLCGDPGARLRVT